MQAHLCFDQRSVRLRWLSCVALLAIVAGCGPDKPQLTGQVTADGSSTVYPLTTAVADEFLKTHRAVKVTVGVSGTGGGFEKFCRGETDVQNASRPIDATERARCDAGGIAFVELPVAYDALTVIVHPSNKWVASMTLDELKALWQPETQKTVTRWSDVRSGWPSEPFHLYGPGPSSGTFDYFTETVVGKTRSSRTDYAAAEDDTVIVKGVAGDPNALGYVGYGYFHQNSSSLKSVAIDERGGTVALGPIAPTSESVRRGIYPLSRTLFIYVSAKGIARPEVAEFVNFYLKEDESLINRVGGISMTGRAYDLVRQRVGRRATGTLFADPNNLNRNLELVLAEVH
jgi:phosphate transport system substrate-binding protein